MALGCIPGMAAAGEPVEVWNGTVTLDDGTYEQYCYYYDSTQTVSNLTPLGALNVASVAGGFSYDVSDKKLSSMGILMLDNVSTYVLDKDNDYGWTCRVNGADLDDWTNNATEGLNIYALADGDEVVFWYSNTTYENATSKVIIDVSSSESGSSADTVWSGTVTLDDGTYDQYCYYYDSTQTVSNLTPLGALNAASVAGGFSYDVSDKKLSSMGILMLDNVSTYVFDKDNGFGWTCRVNGADLDDYTNNATEGLNIYSLADSDELIFWYSNTTYENATAKVLIDVSVGGSASSADTVWSGTVTLDDGTYDQYCYYYDTTQTVDNLTPLGALHAASVAGGFSFDVSDKKLASMGILMLDNVSTYVLDKDNGFGWTCRVNGADLDDYNNNATDGLNIYTLEDGDSVIFWYSNTTYENATAIITIDVSGPQVPVNTPSTAVDVLFEGSVALPAGTFGWQGHDIQNMTPHGALEAAGAAGGFSYVGSWHVEKATALIDDIGVYAYDGDNAWNYQLNGVYQNYFSDVTGVSNNIVEDGDYVEFYYGPKAGTTLENAQAVIRIWVNPAEEIVPKDVIFDGPVTLGAGEITLNVTQPEAAVDCTINERTPIGALDAAATDGGFTYLLSNKRWDYDALLLDGIESYLFEKSVQGWACYVNDELVDDYNGDLNTVALSDGDEVLYLFGEGDVVYTNATAIVRITVGEAAVPAEASWPLVLKNGDNEIEISQAYFEQGVTCGHSASYTDDDGTWQGVPLWYLVGLIDDETDTSTSHTPGDFNDYLAEEGYSVKVTSFDGYSINFESAAIARDDTYIVTNTLNGTELPTLTPGGKNCWPLQMKGDSVSAGQLVGGIKTIELIGVPEEPEGWVVRMSGVYNDTLTQAEFEEGPCHGAVEWTDIDGNVWSGVPLWYIVAMVDNYETEDHWTFDDSVVGTYQVEVVASDGYSRTFESTDIARSADYILANKMNGQELADGNYPLRLVGANVSTAEGALTGAAVGAVARINLPGLMYETPTDGSWNLTLEGKIDTHITQAEFEEALACPHHYRSYTAPDGSVYEGIPLYVLCGWVDDRIAHGSDAFNTALAEAGYSVIYTASDGYSKELPSADVAWNDNIIVASKLNGSALVTTNPDKPVYPLRLVGSGLSEGSFSVGGIVKIELTNFFVPEVAEPITIITYGPDGTSVINETVITLEQMKELFPVYGDGETVYKFEGLSMPPADPWDQAEIYPGTPPFKIEEAIMGTSVHDLVEYAGGMVPDTEIKFIASDGWESTFHYDDVYTPEPAQGEMVLAWNSSRTGEMPAYDDGYRIFFMTDDHIFGQWDMHETIDEAYWHYNSGLPSCAGLSAKWIRTIKLYSAPEPSWTLEMEGAIPYNISKGYFESALGCAMSGHKQEYTDSSNRTWEGMALWTLCGFVDDDNPHVGLSYNEQLALRGYDVHVIASDGSEAVFNSTDLYRSNDYIIANSLNGTHIDGEDSSWPLRLVGDGATGMNSVKGVVRIILDVSLSTPINSMISGFQIPQIHVDTSGGMPNVTVEEGTTGANVTELVGGSGILLENFSSSWEQMTLYTTNTTTSAPGTCSGTLQSALATTSTITAETGSAGTVQAHIDIELAGLPGGDAGINTTISKEPNDVEKTQFFLAAEGAGDEITAIAYTITVEKTNLANAADGGLITGAYLTMTVSEDWVNNNGGRLAVYRRSDDGSVIEEISIISSTTAGGYVTIVAYSPHGLSTFILASVSSAASPSYPDTDGDDPYETIIPASTAPTTETGVSGVPEMIKILPQGVTVTTDGENEMIHVDKRIIAANGGSALLIGEEIIIKTDGRTLSVTVTDGKELGEIISGTVRTVSFTPADAGDILMGTGRVSGGFTLVFVDMPGTDAAYSLSLATDLSSEEINALKAVAGRSGLTLGDVAFAMNLVTEGDMNVGSTRSITLTVPEMWVEAAGGPDSIQIFTWTTGSDAQLPATTVAGTDDAGGVTFTANVKGAWDSFVVASFTKNDVSAGQTATPDTQTGTTTPAASTTDTQESDMNETPVSGVLPLFGIIVAAIAFGRYAGSHGMKKR